MCDYIFSNKIQQIFNFIWFCWQNGFFLSGKKGDKVSGTKTTTVDIYIKKTLAKLCCDLKREKTTENWFRASGKLKQRVF